MNNCHKHARHFSDSELHEYQVPRSLLTLYWIQFFNLATEMPSDMTITSVRSNHLTLCRNFLKNITEPLVVPHWVISGSRRQCRKLWGFRIRIFYLFLLVTFFRTSKHCKEISFVIQCFSPLVNISSHHLLVVIASCFALLFTTFGKYLVFLFTIPDWIGTWSGGRGWEVLGRST